MAFGVFHASSRNLESYEDIDFEGIKKFQQIFSTWSQLYLSHHEFAEKLDAALTQDQQKNFVGASTLVYNCLTLNFGSAFSTIICIDNGLQDYDMKKIDILLNKIEKVKINLPAEKVRDVSATYKKIIEIYKKLDLSVIKLLKTFNEEEKKFVETFVIKYNHWAIYFTDINAFSDFQAFLKDIELVQQVYNKFKEIEKLSNFETLNLSTGGVDFIKLFNQNVDNLLKLKN